MRRYVIENCDTGMFWGRGHWWYDIHSSTIYRSWLKAEDAAHKFLSNKNILAQIVGVIVSIRRA